VILTKNYYHSYWMDCIDSMLTHGDLSTVEDVGFYSVIGNMKLKVTHTEKEIAKMSLQDMSYYLSLILATIEKKVRFSLEVEVLDLDDYHCEDVLIKEKLNAELRYKRHLLKR
jgi:hypothetical protein